MAEYIEKMETILSYQETVTPLVAMTDRGDREFVTVVRDSDVVAFLEQVKPANVRPVVRSHWKKNDNGTYSCKRCHSWIPEEQWHYANWCLYCGADMKQDKEDK